MTYQSQALTEPGTKIILLLKLLRRQQRKPAWLKRVNEIPIHRKMST